MGSFGLSLALFHSPPFLVRLFISEIWLAIDANCLSDNDFTDTSLFLFLPLFGDNKLSIGVMLKLRCLGLIYSVSWQLWFFGLSTA